MINVLMVEDNEIQLQALTIILKDAFPHMKFYKARYYNEAIKIIDNIIFQLFLLDIDLNESNKNYDGIRLGEYIRNITRYQTTPILYLTGKPDEIFNALHKTNCYDYLVKPYNSTSLLTSINRLLDIKLIQQPPLEFRDIFGTYARLPHDTIIYIKAMRHHTAIYTTNNYYETTNFTIKELLQVLPNYFLQCHRSYIVNSNFINNFDNSTALINLSTSPNSPIPVGRNYKKIVKELFI